MTRAFNFYLFLNFQFAIILEVVLNVFAPSGMLEMHIVRDVSQSQSAKQIQIVLKPQSAFVNPEHLSALQCVKILNVDRYEYIYFLNFQIAYIKFIYQNAECRSRGSEGFCQCKEGYDGNPKDLGQGCRSKPKACTSNADCGPDTYCDGQICKPPCTRDNDCAATEVCLRSQCQPVCDTPNACGLNSG